MNQMPPGVAFHYCTLLNATTGGGGGKGKQGDLLKTQLGLGFAEEKTSQRRGYCQINRCQALKPPSREPAAERLRLAARRGEEAAPRRPRISQTASAISRVVGPGTVGSGCTFLGTQICGY